MREQISRLIDIRNQLSEAIEKLKPESNLTFKGNKATIALIVGHEQNKPGAYAKAPIGDYEYFFNSALAHITKDIAVERGHNVRIFYRDEIGIVKAYQDVNTLFMLSDFNNCVAIELHFNSYSDSAANGSEVLMCDSLDVPDIHEREFAQIMLDSMVNALGTRKRGVKILAEGDGERGFKNISQVVKAPSILIEPFFGSCDGDCEKAYQHRNELSKSIVVAVETFIERNTQQTSGAI